MKTKYFLFFLILKIVISVPKKCPGSPECNKNGVCIDMVCICDVGWEGEDCSVEKIECPGTPPCSNHGICYFTNCICENGYTGIDCSTSINTDPCIGFTCIHGTCNNGTCICENGYTGIDCSTSINTDPCIGITCIHGTCNNGTCICENGYTGIYCSSNNQVKSKSNTNVTKDILMPFLPIIIIIGILVLFFITIICDKLIKNKKTDEIYLNTNPIDQTIDNLDDSEFNSGKKNEFEIEGLSSLSSPTYFENIDCPNCTKLKLCNQHFCEQVKNINIEEKYAKIKEIKIDRLEPGIDQENRIRRNSLEYQIEGKIPPNYNLSGPHYPHHRYVNSFYRTTLPFIGLHQPWKAFESSHSNIYN